MKLAPRVISLFLARRAKSRVRTPPEQRSVSALTVQYTLSTRWVVQSKLARVSLWIQTFPFSFSASFLFHPAPLSPSFPLPRYIKLGAGEASDNRFNRWTVKEIVASTPSRSHNVKSTGDRERERGRERHDLSTEGKEKFDFRQGNIVVFRRKTSVVNYLLGVSGSWTGQLGRRDSNAWLIDRRNKIRRVGGYFSGNLWPGISRWTFFLVGRRRNRCYAKWGGWRRKLNLIFDV